MTEMQHAADLEVGSIIQGPTRAATRLRMFWYGDGLESAIHGERRRAQVHIHTDDEAAKYEGLPGVIADGMSSTNWISTMLTKKFGVDYIERGELRTKFIKPIFADVVVSTKGQVRSIERMEDGAVRYVLDVWCEDADGTKLTVGEAAVVVAPRG